MDDYHPFVFVSRGMILLFGAPFFQWTRGGLFAGGNRVILVHLHPLLRFAPVPLSRRISIGFQKTKSRSERKLRTFSYSYQMSRSAPNLSLLDSEVHLVWSEPTEVLFWNRPDHS